MIFAKDHPQRTTNKLSKVVFGATLSMKFCSNSHPQKPPFLEQNPNISGTACPN